MGDEYNHLDDIGLMEDRQFICSSHGLITMNDNAKNLCARFIKNGSKVYDVLARYEEVSIFQGKTMKEGASRDLIRTMAPLLRANGVTDQSAYIFGKEDLKLMPGAERAMKYIADLQPTFINTSSIEQHMMSVAEKLGFNMGNINSSILPFEPIVINKKESKELREFCTAISKMDPKRIPTTLPEQGEPYDRDGWEMLVELDRIFLELIPDMEFFPELANISSVGANEKSYTLLEIRRQSSIDFDSTLYVGSGPTDHQVLDIVRDGGGLAVSFNGASATVRNADVAIISPDATVVAVIAAEYYNEGIEAVYELIKNWNVDYLREKEGPDKYLLNTFIKKYPNGLPEVIRVNNKNVKSVTERSEEFRKKQYRN